MKVVLFANTDWYLYNFRLPLANHLREQGNEVIFVSPSGEYGQKFRDLGFAWYPLDFARKGTNPILELQTLSRLTALYRAIAPDLLHHFTIKCVLYGGIAARRLGIPTVAAITGLGHVFTSASLKNRILRPLIAAAYRFSLKKAEVIFQNPDDRDAFLSRRLVKAESTHLIRGSGINTTLFSPPYPHLAAQLKPCYVLFVGRLLREKGVAEFIDAARIVYASNTNVLFQLAGDTDEGNPSSFTRTEIQRWALNSNIAFLGHYVDMPALLAKTDICVLPSYREGTPRSLLEAAACAIPLVATDVPGCREICRDGINGFLVPPRDAAALASAIMRLVNSADLRRTMGNRGRDIAIAEFAEERVIDETMKVYSLSVKSVCSA